MKEPRWITRDETLALHQLMLEEYGGISGVRDDNMLQSALAKPQQNFAYAKPDLSELAASYAYGVVKNHPFLDGNKRTGFMLAVSFIELNVLRFTATEVDAALRTLALAAGEMTEPAYAAWLKANSKRAKK